MFGFYAKFAEDASLSIDGTRRTGRRTVCLPRDERPAMLPERILPVTDSVFDNRPLRVPRIRHGGGGEIAHQWKCSEQCRFGSQQPPGVCIVTCPRPPCEQSDRGDHHGAKDGQANHHAREGCWYAVAVERGGS